jgi:hypothetical protein
MSGQKYQERMDSEILANILADVARIHYYTTDPTMRPLLDETWRQRMADTILAGSIAGVCSLDEDGSVILMWRHFWDKWHLEVSDLYGRYPHTTAAVNAYFERERFVATLAAMDAHLFNPF